MLFDGSGNSFFHVLSSCQEYPARIRDVIDLVQSYLDAFTLTRCSSPVDPELILV
jgi:hypothetical protein